MKRVFVLTILILVAFSLSAVFADGWVDAESEIQKSVQENSTKSSTVEFIDLAASILNGQNVVNKDGINTQVNGEGENGNDPYAMVVVWSAQEVKKILESGNNSDISSLLSNIEELLKGDFTGYFGNTDDKLSLYPTTTLNMGTYMLAKSGSFEFPLSFLFVSTNATITISVKKNNGEIPLQFAFVSLKSNLTTIQQNMTSSNVYSILFNTKPLVNNFAAAISTTMENPSRENKTAVKSLWMKINIPKDTRAGIYREEIIITVSAHIEGW
ncbi:hypothetical protein [Mesoaciditoga lauensis]|uniref:hypothetical protein n=1 Tax=Mesoaciditoga lauensis TaxID=1495039 RepID=UPI000569D0E9|nr:hypothetical protein [Mesoaciditoga lauensis]